MSTAAPDASARIARNGPPDASPASALGSATCARALVRAAALIGTALVLDAAVQGSAAQPEVTTRPLWAMALAALGVALLYVAPQLADRALLRGGLRTLVGRGNAAAAIVSAGHHVAVGFLISHSLGGADAEAVAVSLIFFVIGFATLLALQWLYRRVTVFADDQEVRADNAAAAVSFTGVTLALALIIGHATWGSFAGWKTSLQNYATALLLAVFLYPVRQVIVKRLLLGLPLSYRGGKLDQEIAQQRNIMVATVEGIAYVAVALLVTGLL